MKQNLNCGLVFAADDNIIVHRSLPPKQGDPPIIPASLSTSCFAFANSLTTQNEFWVEGEVRAIELEKGMEKTEASVGWSLGLRMLELGLGFACQ